MKNLKYSTKLKFEFKQYLIALYKGKIIIKLYIFLINFSKFKSIQ